MTLLLKHFILGSLQNNTFLLANEATREALVVDPAEGSALVADEATRNGWKVTAVLLTHAHFDHFIGFPSLCTALSYQPPIYLHESDLPLYVNGGGARQFGFTIPTMPLPTQDLSSKSVLNTGEEIIQVFHTPGHSPGHVIFYIPSLATALVGDVIFYRGIGRTDLPGGDYEQLLGSIKNVVFRLPDETILFPGHGPETSVASEQKENPFL
jgi:glyoxylase-like metal-dependent hydrolase (beta-lactamase superfamily II)